MKYSLLERRFFYVILVFSFCLTLPGKQAMGQVTVSVGVQEVYDSNIFLEDDKEVSQSIIEEAVGSGDLDPDSVKQIDGDPNDDLITSPSITISAPIPLSEKLETSLETKVGALIFAEESDQDRLTLDVTAKVRTKETLLPQPFFAEISDTLSSESEDITVAEGATAKQSQSNSARAQVGVEKWEFAPKTELGTGYTFLRHDSLGEFLFSSNDDDALGDLIDDEEGADYYSHAVGLKVLHHLKDNLDIHGRGEVDYLDFTSVDSSDPESATSDELDRLDSTVLAGFSYRASEKVELSGEAGASISSFSDDPEPRVETIVSPDGTLTEVFSDPDSTETSFEFDLGLAVTPNESTSITGRARQSNTIDIDGSRLTSRRFVIDASRKIGERYEIALGGQITQFEEGDSLSSSTDRYEATALVRYAVTEAISLAVGYNFATQEQDSGATEDLFGTNDYESHRAFISLNAGIVGVKG